MDLERIKSVIDLMSENDLCEFSIEAVSYTHLDVYKRQVWTRR